MKENDNRSVLMIISSMLIFGSIGILIRYIPLPSAFIAFFRGSFGGLFIFIVLKLKHHKVTRLPIDKLIWLSVSGAVMAFNWIFLFEAYSYTSVAVATLCYYMQPTIVVLLSPFLFKERLTRKKMICVILSIIGMIFVSGILNGGSLASSSMKGIILGLGAAVLYSTVVIMNKQLGGIDAYLKTTIQLLSAGLVMIPYMFMTDSFDSISFTPPTVILLLIIGLVHTGLAYTLYFGSIDGLKAQSVAIFSYIDPVAALFLSSVFLHEPLDAFGMIGAVLIIGSAIISETRLKSLER
ncbi:MAG: EamA family transporter [Spirochaetales bacterium]|nr:EamA family transporter [Spirochaetales bacterium]